MPTPASAPPSVMVFSWGTTAGMTPCGRQASTSVSYGVMPSASTKPSPTLRTSLKARTSRRRRGAASRSRKRFDVSFSSATAPWLALSLAASSSFFLAWRCVAGIEEIPCHRIARARDVALREDDLEEVRLPVRRAEHLRAAVEVHAPDAPEALVEAPGVERADPVPVAVEALGPVIERERIVPAQVLDVEDLEPGALHLDDRVGEARDPAARENVLADE